MSALSIQPPFPIFTGIDGQPLENGYVWIGVANLDPEGNPITVYWDEALTIPAPQPIRTVSGYPARAGSPARLYVNSDYSIRVLDKNGTLVYGAPESTELLSSAFITFVQSGAGTVERTVQAKLRETVSVKDFGAVGDGVMDDTAVIQAAIDAVATNGVLNFPVGVYKTSATLNITDDIKLYGQGATIQWLNGVAQNIITVTASNFECRGLRFVGGTKTAAGNTITQRAIGIVGPCDYVTVQDNQFEYFSLVAVYLESSALQSTEIQNILITQNVFKGNDDQLQAITCFGGNQAIISNNIVDGCNSVAILCDAGTTTTPLNAYALLKNFVVSDNIITMPTTDNPIVSYGIQVTDCESTAVTGNIVNGNGTTNGGRGIVVTIYDLGQQAGAPGGGAAYLPIDEDNARVVVSGNSVHNWSQPIFVRGFKAPVISNNNVTATNYGILCGTIAGTVNSVAYTFPTGGQSLANISNNVIVSKDSSCIGMFLQQERNFVKDNVFVGTFAKRYEDTGVSALSTQVIQDADQQLNGATTLRFKQLMSGRLNYSSGQTNKTVSLVQGPSNVIDRFVGNTSLAATNYFVLTQADWDTTVRIVKTGKTSFEVVAGTTCPTNNLGIYWALFITEA
jgi:hypothetical protein